MASVLGIEIGNDSLKIAVCSAGKVKKLICEKLPENMVRGGKVAIPDAMSEFLKEIRKKYKLSAKKVNLVLPEQHVMTKNITMPLMSDAELRLNLPYEFKDYIEDEKSTKVDFIYDYVVLSSTEATEDKPGQLELFGAAISAPFIEEYKSIFKKAGFKLVAGIPREMALQNLVRASKNAPSELVIVDVGHTKTNIDIFCNGVYSMGKTIEIGGQMIDSVLASVNKVDEHVARTHKETNLDNCLSLDNCVDIYNQIAMEVIRTVNFYNYSTHSEHLNDIYFTGGLSLVELLRTKLVKGTELNPHEIGKLFSDSEDQISGGIFCSLAVGAGIQPAKEPKPTKPEKTDADKKDEKEEKGESK